MQSGEQQKCEISAIRTIVLTSDYASIPEHRFELAESAVN